jgi:hypothetical protein
MRIDSIHDFLNDLLQKEQKGYKSHPELDKYLDRAQMWMFNSYQQAYAVNQEAQDALSPFKKSIDFGTDINGNYAIPSSENYQNMTGAGIAINIVGVGVKRAKIKFVTEDEYDDRMRSQIRKPSLTEPIGLFTGLGKIHIEPAAVYAGTVRFLRRPVAPKYDFDQSGRAITYKDSTSVQLEWGERYQNKIILKALEFAGLSLSEDRLIEIGEALQKANV